MPRRSAIILLFALVGTTVRAHHNPEETIALISEEISREGGSADLYYRRATEYRQLRRDAEAEADFRQVALLQPDDPEAYRSLAQLLLWQQKLRPARVEARHAIERASDPRLRAACRILLAQIEQAENHDQAALAACELAFLDQPAGEIDWFLLRAEIHQSLGQNDLRIGGLQQGYALTGSIVLRNAWVDAQLDAGIAENILPLIEKELAACRLKSSWLLRHARALICLDRAEEARTDLERAVAEIDARMSPIRPHADLLLDRATALALLNRPDEARRDYLAAESLDAEPAQLRRLRNVLTSTTGTPPEPAE